MRVSAEDLAAEFAWRAIPEQLISWDEATRTGAVHNGEARWQPSAGKEIAMSTQVGEMFILEPQRPAIETSMFHRSGRAPPPHSLAIIFFYRLSIAQAGAIVRTFVQPMHPRKEV